MSEEVQPIQPLYRRLLQGLSESERETAQVAFYVIADRTFVFRRIDADEFQNIHQWGVENRLAAVIQRGNQVFAHVSPQMAENLQQRRPQIEGVDATVKALTQDEYDEVVKVGEAVQGVLQSEIVEETEAVTPSTSWYSVMTTAASDYIKSVRLFLSSLERIPEKIKIKLLQKWQENLAAIEEKKREDEKRQRIKEQDISDKEIDRGIRRGEVHKEEQQRFEDKRMGRKDA